MENPRARANQIWSERSALLNYSQKQFSEGDKAGAKRSSERAHELEALARKEDAKASQKIFTEKNATLGSLKIDLHGLYVEESLGFLKERIEVLQRGGVRENLVIIYGAGHHSQDHKAHVKPAVLDYLRGEGIPVREGYDTSANRENGGLCSAIVEPKVDPSTLKIKLPQDRKSKATVLRGESPSSKESTPTCCIVM